MFKDCFGNKLQDGDDVIISVDDILHSGIVMKVLDDFIIIYYNNWVDGKEKEYDLQYHLSDTDGGKLQNIYKL